MSQKPGAARRFSSSFRSCFLASRSKTPPESLEAVAEGLQAGADLGSTGSHASNVRPRRGGARFPRARLLERVHELPARGFGDGPQQGEHLLAGADRVDRDLALRQARNGIGAYLDACTSAVPWEQYKIIGFSSMGQQNVASLALAKRFKATWPHKTIVIHQK